MTADHTAPGLHDPPPRLRSGLGGLRGAVGAGILSHPSGLGPRRNRLDATDMGRLVGAWMLGWSVLLVIGYVAELTPWPGLRVLRSPAATTITSGAKPASSRIASSADSAVAVTAPQPPRLPAISSPDGTGSLTRRTRTPSSRGPVRGTEAGSSAGASVSPSSRSGSRRV